MGYNIKGLGTAMPPSLFTQKDALALAQRFAGMDDKKSRLMEVLYRRSGVKQRHTVVNGNTPATAAFLTNNADPEWRGPSTQERMACFEQEVKPLAIQACRTALHNSGARPEEITSLITISCTGFFSPGVDAAIIETLGLPRTVGRTNIGFMGCHASMNGLRVAIATADSQPEGKILMCAAELCTLHFRYGWNPEMAVPNALFGDGAAALIGDATLPTAPSDTWTAKACSSFLVPDSADDMTWRIGDHGFEMTLSSRVPALISKNLPGFLSEWLGKMGMSVNDIQSWIVHPGGPGILEAVRAALNLPDDAIADSRDVLAECGNMSSPTVLFILERLRARNAPRPCVMMAFGPGLVAEAALWV